jgi:hypothetical protein
MIKVVKKREKIWRINKVVDLVVSGRCSKRFVQIVRRSARFHSDPAETVPSIAGIASQSVRTAVAK